MKNTLHFLFLAVAGLIVGHESASARPMTPAEQQVIDNVIAKLNGKLITAEQLNDLVTRAGFRPTFSSYLEMYTFEARTTFGHELVRYGLSTDGQLLFGAKIRDLTAAEEKQLMLIYPPLMSALRAAPPIQAPLTLHVEDETNLDVSNGVDVEHPNFKTHEVLMIWVPVANRGATTYDVANAVAKVLDIIARARRVAPVQ